MLHFHNKCNEALQKAEEKDLPWIFKQIAKGLRHTYAKYLIRMQSVQGVIERRMQRDPGFAEMKSGLSTNHKSWL